MPGKSRSDAGVFANPIITPAVAPGRDLMRNTLMATHTDAQIDHAFRCVEQKWVRVPFLGRAGMSAIGARKAFQGRDRGGASNSFVWAIAKRGCAATSGPCEVKDFYSVVPAPS